MCYAPCVTRRHCRHHRGERGVAAVDLAKAKFVLANFAQVGVPSSWLPRLGALKAAGAVGLPAGLVGVHQAGIAAGLAAFLAGAIVADLRAQALTTSPVPAFTLPQRRPPLPSQSALTDRRSRLGQR